ncbi:oligopeptide/dipeptide ABC transporter ATP-binding protein [Nocardioides daedukensis]|uniref:Oligopeptide/dipeptide ABC transporter ATP-binding protein n=1 Tax=Nocardioides daedukensis TaxID=634462 RepID=A0A7Y9S500_9ACTN|nr:oligopeptide/dipeptide ABC transporter ATP-binding protein [Nocardioides daedukensis]
MALVGESGSGKSTVAQSIMRMIRPPVGDLREGVVSVNGVDVRLCTDQQMRQVLRSEIGFIPQDPTTALDPLYTIRSQIKEVLPPEDKKNADRVITELLESLGIVNAADRLGDYPHEFSGGMKQRVAIAIALAKKPSVLIADEPTTALDVTTQIGILRLLDKLRRERSLATLFITHNIRVARLLCQHVVVMYGGIVVESGPIDQVMAAPSHPYTRALLDASVLGDHPRQKLRAIPGNPPSLFTMPKGCPFSPRCANATDQCHDGLPEETATERGTRYTCWNPVMS